MQAIALLPEARDKKITIARGRTIEISARGLTFDNADANLLDVGVEVEVSLVLPRTLTTPGPFFPALLSGKGRVERIENRVSGSEFRQRVTVVLGAPLRFDIQTRSEGGTSS